MPASPTYAIYAAPRATDGRYRLCKCKPLFIRKFPTVNAMQGFWKKITVPATSTKFGTAYELSMVEASAATWDFIGDPRFADTSIITEQKRTGKNIHAYQDGQ